MSAVACRPGSTRSTRASRRTDRTAASAQHRADRIAVVLGGGICRVLAQCGQAGALELPVRGVRVEYPPVVTALAATRAAAEPVLVLARWSADALRGRRERLARGRVHARAAPGQ